MSPQPDPEPSPRPGAGPGPEAGPRTGKQGADVLLVQDTPHDQELVLRALERDRFAHRVRIVDDGAEALDYLFCQGAYADRDPGHPPRVVLLDVVLPKANGIDVLRAVKGDPRTHNIPVVMLTSSAAEADLVTCYELGANSYIIKPVDIDQYLDAVQNLGLYWLLINRA